MRITYIKLGHDQHSNRTPLYFNNKTAKGIIISTVRQELSKSFDIHFYWMWDWISQKQLELIWISGVLNMADYFTKHHLSWHNKVMQYKYMKNACMAALRAPNQIALRALLSAREVLLPPPARTTTRQESNITTLTSLLQHVTKVATQTKYISRTYWNSVRTSGTVLLPLFEDKFVTKRQKYIYKSFSSSFLINQFCHIFWPLVTLS